MGASAGGEPAGRRWIGPVLSGVSIAVLYVGVTALFTYPAITLANRTYAERMDPLGALWNNWWMKTAMRTHAPVSPMPMVACPWGLSMKPFAVDPLTGLTLKWLSFLSTETVAYNLVLLSSFVLAGVSTYWLVRYLTGNRPAAAFSGLCFAFSPYMLMQGKEHLGLAMTFWMPLFVLALVRAWRERTWPSVVLCALAYMAVVLFNYQYGMMMGVFAAVFVLTVWLAGGPWRRSPGRGRLWKALPVLAAVAAVLVFLLLRLASSVPSKGYGANAALSYSARPWDYVLPGADGLLLGGMTRGFITSHLHGGFLSESTLFLGYVVIALAALAVLLAFRRAGPPPGPSQTRSAAGRSLRMSADGRRTTLAFAICGAVAFILSMPPYFHLGKTRVYLPSRLFLEVFPNFRAYARFGIVVMLSASVLAGIGLSAVLRARFKGASRYLVTAVLMALVLLEFAIVPPFRSLETDETTDYYRWLAGQPTGTLAALYPMYNLDDFSNYEYFFYQRLHRKSLVNGAPDGGESGLYRNCILDITFPATPGLLKRLGTDLVMVLPDSYSQAGAPHRNYVFPTDIEEAPLPDGLEPVKRFRGCDVYRVTAGKASFVPLFTGGFYEPYMDPGGSFWHPATETATVEVRSYRKSPAVCSITFEAMCPRDSCRMTVSSEGARLGGVTLTAHPTTVRLDRVVLKPGNNRLELSTEGKLHPLGEVPGYEDVKACLVAGDIMVEVMP